MIKINSGLCRGLKLKSPKGSHTRPTASRTREAVLNAIQHRLEDAIFFDLFCGSGAMGIEALSRGAKTAYFFDNSKDAIQVLRHNLALVKERSDRSSVAMTTHLVSGELPGCLNRVKGAVQADIVWLDPPYADAKVFLSRHGLRMMDFLTSDGLLIVETGKALQAFFETELKETFEGIANLETLKTYGQTLITTFRKG